MSAPTVEVEELNWRLVEVGRVVLINNKLAAIVDIIDQKRVLIDGPSTDVERQVARLQNIELTFLVLDSISRGDSSDAVKEAWDASDISSQWASSDWAKDIAQKQRRSELNDFERFQVQLLQKQRSLAIGSAAK
ncbi:BA75_03340T0 [Komagataella pastoris]|uniref:BA75_03340T0 n=1 Tax=Komagataella pastoris TaxID=4922 RepID=A0A1B2JGE7_PICPA|nr:BA75_03340T0 [Komagataella pastoris]